MSAIHACSSQSAAAAVAFVTARAADDTDAQWRMLEGLGLDPIGDAGRAVIGLSTLATTALTALAEERGVEVGDVIESLGGLIAGVS